jgi:sulfur relay (sulfurtransferase) DsrF/TusC family protein
MVDMALVLATFECPVSVVLQDAGVLWASLPAMPEASPLALSGKLKSLPLYDIETVYVDQTSCQRRGLSVSDQFPGCLASRNTISNCLASTDVILEA